MMSEEKKDRSVWKVWYTGMGIFGVLERYKNEIVLFFQKIIWNSI